MGLSSPSLTAEELNLLNAIRASKGEDGYARVFDVDDAGNLVSVIAGTRLPAKVLLEKLEKLVEMGMLKAEFESKVLICGRCGSKGLIPKTACPSCGSENIVRTAVYVHGCGAVIPEISAGGFAYCPKCGESLEALEIFEYRFVCNRCFHVFEEPLSIVACPSCGWQDRIKNAGQVVLMKYALTDGGLGVLTSNDPLRLLARRLVLNGYEVRTKVRVRGIGGTEQILDLVATKEDRSETRIYVVFYKIGPDELLNAAAKMIDVDVETVDGVVGRVRWITAGLEVDGRAERLAKSFGMELELIR
jgi:RNA polymerase subunit RPABC4/transcription elongation factor Spt4